MKKSNQPTAKAAPARRMAALYTRIKGRERSTILAGKVVIEFDSARLPMVRIRPQKQAGE